MNARVSILLEYVGILRVAHEESCEVVVAGDLHSNLHSGWVEEGIPYIARLFAIKIELSVPKIFHLCFFHDNYYDKLSIFFFE